LCSAHPFSADFTQGPTSPSPPAYVKPTAHSICQAHSPQHMSSPQPTAYVKPTAHSICQPQQACMHVSGHLQSLPLTICDAAAMEGNSLQSTQPQGSIAQHSLCQCKCIANVVKACRQSSSHHDTGWPTAAPTAACASACWQCYARGARLLAHLLWLLLPAAAACCCCCCCLLLLPAVDVCIDAGWPICSCWM
jgi:hypothetical protein